MPEVFHEELFEHDKPQFLLDDQIGLLAQLIVQLQNTVFLDLDQRSRNHSSDC